MASETVSGFKGKKKKDYLFKKMPQLFSAAGGIFRQKTQTLRTYLK